MYKAGGFEFPTSVGAYSVTGLGFSPQAVVLCGTNSPTMDAIVPYPGGTQYPGYFVSFSGLDYLDGATIRTMGVGIGGGSLIANTGNEWAGKLPVRMNALSSMSSIDYRADAITFDADGFTLNVTHGAPGFRWVHWWAVGEQALGTLRGYSLLGTWPMSFQPQSAIVLATTAQTDYADTVYNGNEAWFSMGAGSFPLTGAVADRTRVVGYSGVIFSTPSIGRQGFTGDFADYAMHQSVHVGVLTLLEDLATFWPSAVAASNLTGGPGFQGYDNVVAWDGPSKCGFYGMPALGNTYHYPPPDEFDQVEALLLMASNNPNSGVATEHNISFAFGMATEDYQGCIAFSRYGELYQSAQHCAVSLDNGDLKTAEADLSAAPGFDVIGLSGGGWTVSLIQFGGSGGFIPQMYRWWSPGKRLSMRT